MNLLVATGQWWNGSTVTSGSSVQGGTGTWNVQAGPINWTDANGATANAWTQGSIAIFAGSAGTVTIAGATTPQTAGMYFLTSGYTVTGGALSLVGFNGQAPVITVGDATPATAGVSATIASALTSASGLVKAGSGTLTLTGGDTITGTTTVNAGALVFSGGTSSTGQVYVGEAAGTAGAFAVSGSGTSLDNGGRSFNIGYDGTGSLTVSNGAALTTGDGTFGYDAGSSGTGVVTGAGSTWNMGNADLYVGYYGAGALTVSDGATVSAGSATIGYLGDPTGGSLTVTGADRPSISDRAVSMPAITTAVS